jgi:histidyl-tRNA synthetase
VVEALAGVEIAMASMSIEQLMRFLSLSKKRAEGSGASNTKSNAQIVEELGQLKISDEMFSTGMNELAQVLESIDSLGVPSATVGVDLSIARGLDYYTGTIYETTLNDFPGIGSVCSGGRYDDLAGLYTRSKLPGVGLSIGLTRLYFQLKEAGRIVEAPNPCAVYVTICEPSLAQESRAIATELRQKGINVELAPEPQKLQKQLKYADRVGIQFVIIYGEPERERNAVALKDLRTNQQVDVPRDVLAETLLQRIKTATDARKS